MQPQGVPLPSVTSITLDPLPRLVGPISSPPFRGGEGRIHEAFGHLQPSAPPQPMQQGPLNVVPHTQLLIQRQPPPASPPRASIPAVSTAGSTPPLHPHPTPRNPPSQSPARHQPPRLPAVSMAERLALSVAEGLALSVAEGLAPPGSHPHLAHEWLLLACAPLELYSSSRNHRGWSRSTFN